jgi:hypothetical protein
MRPNVTVQIDSLLLEGFAPGDRHRIGKALQAELLRLLAEEGVPAPLTAGGERPRLDAGQFTVAPSTPAESVGAEVARAVYGGLGR